MIWKSYHSMEKKERAKQLSLKPSNNTMTINLNKRK